MHYELMNKNTKIAGIQLLDNKIYIESVYSTLPPYIHNLDTWVQNRLSPIGRKNIQLLLKQANISSISEFLYITKAISLTDTFWINCLEHPTVWDSINPYKNKFSRVISEIALNCNYYGGQLRSPSPDYTVDGSVDKCWKRKNGKIYLYKTDGERWSSLAGLRPYCEYYATQVAEQLGLHSYVKYGLTVSKTHNGNIKPYAFSEIFTSEQYGYVPIAYTDFTNKPLEEVYRVLNDESKLILREMLVLDSIIVNFDRHQGNYGFLFNTDNFKFKSMAPIFDNDCSLGALLSIQFKTIQEAYQELLDSRNPQTDLGGYINQAKISLTDKLISNMKNMYPFHFKRLPSEIDIDDDRIEFMEYIVNNQIKAILGK